MTNREQPRDSPTSYQPLTIVLTVHGSSSTAQRPQYNDDAPSSLFSYTRHENDSRFSTAGRRGVVYRFPIVFTSVTHSNTRRSRSTSRATSINIQQSTGAIGNFQHDSALPRGTRGTSASGAPPVPVCRPREQATIGSEST